ASIQAALAQTVARLGRVDMLINSAGITGPTMALDAFDDAVWQRVIAINLVGVYNVCKAVVPVLRTQGYGRVVNIASLAGKEGTPNASAYSAAKAGVLALTKSLGKELAGSGVLVNAVAPAAVRTPILEQMAPEHVATMVAKSPMGRLGEPEEIAAQVLWLASDACSFSTGAVFDVSGGRATY
uniref:SDR family NAD(P)-dependent oxidoreductase n=1 Tax=Comamonas sp. TaxID=34028 RepID=UPI0028AA39AB